MTPAKARANGCSRLFGYDQGLLGGLITLPTFTSVFPEICTTKECNARRSVATNSHVSTIQGIAVSCYNLGCFIGALAAMRYGQVFGRRRAIVIGCTFVTIGAILQCSAFGLAHFIVGRVICGFGTGINTSTVPIWLSETTKPHQRGPVVAFGTTMVIAGVCLSYWVDFGFSYIQGSAVAWRFPVAFQIVFALLVLGLVLPMPESPRWLVMKDRVEEAAQVISALYDLPEDDPVVADQLSAIRAVQSVDAQGSLKKMFVQGPLKNRTRMFLGVSLQIFSQLSGINIITYYAAVIYENEIGLSPHTARFVAAGNGTQYFFASLFSILIIKYFGRRKVIMTVSAGQAISMMVLAICNAIGGKGPGIVAAAFLFVFNTFFGCGYAQISVSH
jgi:sugar porter (SP) family MFS transporter